MSLCPIRAGMGSSPWGCRRTLVEKGFPAPSFPICCRSRAGAGMGLTLGSRAGREEGPSPGLGRAAPVQPSSLQDLPWAEHPGCSRGARSPGMLQALQHGTQALAGTHWGWRHPSKDPTPCRKTVTPALPVPDHFPLAPSWKFLADEELGEDSLLEIPCPWSLPGTPQTAWDPPSLAKLPPRFSGTSSLPGIPQPAGGPSLPRSSPAWPGTPPPLSLGPPACLGPLVGGCSIPSAPGWGGRGGAAGAGPGEAVGGSRAGAGAQAGPPPPLPFPSPPPAGPLLLPLPPRAAGAGPSRPGARWAPLRSPALPPPHAGVPGGRHLRRPPPRHGPALGQGPPGRDPLRFRRCGRGRGALRGDPPSGLGGTGVSPEGGTLLPGRLGRGCPPRAEHRGGLHPHPAGG